MLKTRLIPCMLFNGFNLIKTIEFTNIRNLGNPTQMARVYNSRHADELIFIDMKATEDHRPPLYDVVENIVKECFMPLTIGGGIRSLEDIERFLKIGADKVALNTIVLQNPEFLKQAAEKYGRQCLVVSLDVKKVDNEYSVFTDRGRTNTGITALNWAKQVENLGAGELFLNSIDRDGQMGGYDCTLVSQISGGVSIPVIACGGAGKVQDIIDVIQIGHASAAALSSMFHYSGHTFNTIKQRMSEAGIPVRLI